MSKKYEDLTSYGKSSSDYYTPEEMLQFKKPRKKKSLRKKEKLDLDALEADAKSIGLGAGDLGSRKDQSRPSSKLEQERAEAQMRSEAYESALARAQEASMALARAETLTIAKAEEDDGPVFGEDYEDLQRSLERARKLALSRQEEAAASGPQAIALEVKSKSVEIDSRASAEPQENKVVITEMEEFVLGLQFNEGMLLSLSLSPLGAFSFCFQSFNLPLNYCYWVIHTMVCVSPSLSLSLLFWFPKLQFITELLLLDDSYHGMRLSLSLSPFPKLQFINESLLMDD